MNFDEAAKKGPIYQQHGVILYTFLIINDDNCEFGLLFFVPGDKLKFDNNIFTVTPKNVARDMIRDSIDDRDGNYYYFGETVFGIDMDQIKYLIGKRITFAQKEIEDKAKRHIASEARPARDSKPDSYGFKSRRRSRKRVVKSVKKSRKRVAKSVKKSRKRVAKSVKKSRKRVIKSVKKSRKRKSRPKRISKSVRKKFLFYLKKFQE
jgi:hypothetical protein